MRVVHASFVRPPHHADPDRLLEEWPTLIDIAASVANAGAEVTLVQSFARDLTVARRGVQCRFVREPALPGSWSGLAPWRAAGAAAESKPDIIHVNGLDFAAHTRAMTATSVPVLAQDHASRPGAGRMRRRWGLARIAGAAFTAAEQALPFIEEGSLAKQVRIFSVPESSTHFSAGNQVEARASTGTYGDPLVLWVGRLDENKDPLTVLDAVELAAAELPQMQLWCCFHEQPLLDGVQTRIAQSALLRQRVHLVGKVPHERIELLCRAADIFIAASHREGSGYALIEALACGATPVVSDIPPFRTLVGDAGGLAIVADAQSFARELIRVARMPRAKLRQRALDHFARNLSFEAVGGRLRDIYSALVSGAE